jgi:hypothetical protein
VSFGAGFQAQAGDLFEIDVQAFGKPLRYALTSGYRQSFPRRAATVEKAQTRLTSIPCSSKLRTVSSGASVSVTIKSTFAGLPNTW